MAKNLNNFELSMAQLEKEFHYARKKGKYRARLRRALGTILVLSAIGIMVVVLWFPVLQVTGEAMSPQLESGQLLLSLRMQELCPGDIAAFHYNNHVLARRVIARSGDQVHIDDSGRIVVNGAELDDGNVGYEALGAADLSYPYEVPDGCIFVLCDNPAAAESGIYSFGCIDSAQIIGKVIFRIWPIQTLEYLG